MGTSEPTERKSVVSRLRGLVTRVGSHTRICRALAYVGLTGVILGLIWLGWQMFWFGATTPIKPTDDLAAVAIVEVFLGCLMCACLVCAVMAAQAYPVIYRWRKP